MKSKRGQITIFIIIGLILLLSVATVVYFYQARITAPIKKVVTVPEDVQQIYDYVATCTDQIGKDGLIIMGAQGGYINIPATMERNPSANIPNDPAGITRIPLWYYEGEDRTPTLEYMQRELAMYVKQYLPECTGNFESFKQRYEITPKGDILPVVTFTDSEAIIQVKWQLDIKVQDRITQLTEFISSFPVKIKPMWELASKTMDTENKQGWFENLTIDLMASNSRIPLTGMEFTCGTKKWHIREVKKEIQNMLYYNLPYVRIDNTVYPAPIASMKTYDNLKADAQNIREKLEAGKEPSWPENPPADVFEMNRMRLDVGIRQTDLKAAFTYQPEWPLLVNAQPNQAGILSTAQMKGARKYLRFICLNQWHFAYDLIYPIKMSIKDDTAFNGEGYIFQMGFPVIIEDNEESRIFFGIRKFVVPDTGIDFCTGFGTTTADIRAVGFTEGGIVAEELEGANITYRCLNQECILGNTYSDGTGAIRLTAYLPEGCSNPLFTAKKEGYIEGQKHLQKDITEITLTKLQKMNYTIIIHPYYEEVDRKDPTKATNQQWLDAQTYNKFTKTMHATIAITPKNTSLEEFKMYPANSTSEEYSAENEYVEFIYGNAQYDIDILLFKGDTPVGGYHAENLTIKYDELVGKKNAIFHVVEYRPLPETSEQQAGMFLFLYERGKYQEQPYWQKLKPTFTP